MTLPETMALKTKQSLPPLCPDTHDFCFGVRLVQSVSCAGMLPASDGTSKYGVLCNENFLRRKTLCFSSWTEGKAAKKLHLTRLVTLCN